MFDKIIENIKERILASQLTKKFITFLCTSDFYGKLMKKFPPHIKIGLELHRRGLKRKHIHKARRNK